MPEVVHDPLTDWCACLPGGMNRCDYRLLADTVIEELNPKGDDAAEVALCADAVASIAGYVRSMPCTCAEGDDEDPCGRCAALGQRYGKPVQR